MKSTTARFDPKALAAHRAEQARIAADLDARGLWGTPEAIAAREAAFEVEMALCARAPTTRHIAAHCNDDGAS